MWETADILGGGDLEWQPVASGPVSDDATVEVEPGRRYLLVVQLPMEAPAWVADVLEGALAGLGLGMLDVSVQAVGTALHIQWTQGG